MVWKSTGNSNIKQYETFTKSLEKKGKDGIGLNKGIERLLWVYL